MSIEFHKIGYADHLKPEAQGGGTLHLVCAKSQAAVLEIPAGWRSLWMPISGGLRVASRDLEWKLSSRDYLFWHEGALQNYGRRSSWFLALCGPPTAWQAHLPTLPGRSFDQNCIFPAHARCPRDIRRLLVRLARVSTRTDASPMETDHVVGALLDAIWDNQESIRLHLQQCRGRTEKRRQQNFVRLLKVKHVIENGRDGNFDLLHMARIANYSPWHLTRTYREVFGESPSQYATRLRFARAVDLVHESKLTIREITEALGYESQSTFCRYFKKTYGATTTEARSAKAANSF